MMRPHSSPPDETATPETFETTNPTDGIELGHNLGDPRFSYRPRPLLLALLAVVVAATVPSGRGAPGAW